MVTRSTIKRLEKMLGGIEPDYLMIPLMATPEEVEAIEQEAKRQGKKTRGIPLVDLRKKNEQTPLNNY